MISVNGAAAHKAAPGDLVIICAYGACDEAEAAKPTPVPVAEPAKDDSKE